MGIILDEKITTPQPPKMWLINGNCFTEAFCKNEETAIQYAKTLVNCVDCVDCVECQNCKRCVSCKGCVECYDCKNCSYATLASDEKDFVLMPSQETKDSLKHSLILNDGLDFKPLTYAMCHCE